MKKIAKNLSNIYFKTTPHYDLVFDGFNSEWPNLKDTLKKMQIKINNHYNDYGRHEFTISTNKVKLEQLLKQYGDLQIVEYA